MTNHRPPDSRLLTSLLSYEKEYIKSLQTLLLASSSSLASFAAYAAASPPSSPIPHALLRVGATLGAADEAMRRYLGAVESWREGMRQLKDLEEEVGCVVRDREILYVLLFN